MPTNLPCGKLLVSKVLVKLEKFQKLEKDLLEQSMEASNKRKEMESSMNEEQLQAYKRQKKEQNEKERAERHQRKAEKLERRAKRKEAKELAKKNREKWTSVLLKKYENKTEKPVKVSSSTSGISRREINRKKREQKKEAFQKHMEALHDIVRATGYPIQSVLTRTKKGASREKPKKVDEFIDFDQVLSMNQKMSKVFK